MANETSVPWPARAVEGIGLDEGSTVYLVEIGLPRTEGPFLWLAPPDTGELPMLLGWFGRDDARMFPTRGDRALASTMRVLGRDEGGSPVVLLRDGRVMRFDVSARELEDVNGSLRALAACDVAARTWASDEAADLETVFASLAAIDPATDDDDGFWRTRLRAHAARRAQNA